MSGLVSSAGDADEAMREVASSASSRVVLPDPLGPMNTTTEGSRISGLARTAPEVWQGGSSAWNAEVENYFLADRVVVGYGKCVNHYQ